MTARREVWSLNSTMKLEMFTGDLVPIGYKEVLREQEVQVSNDAKDVPSQIVDLSIRGVYGSPRPYMALFDVHVTDMDTLMNR